MLRSRGFWISAASTVVFVLLLLAVLLTAPGIHNLKEGLFNVHQMRAALPSVWDGFKINLKMMVIAEVLVLICALGVAILRGLPGPAAFPLRVVAIVYTDVFRGLPTILVAIFIGLGFPSLGLSVISTQSPFTYGVLTLVLVYSAYVAEVYRAGIESVHQSQTAAARSLGLSYTQTLRFVILPQAVRRVIPPLVNDFIGLQKDTALVFFIGVIEALQAAQDYANVTYNLSGLTVAGLLFIAITIPLTRLVDYLVARDRRRMQAAG
jgi:polar amino acid transport system permease protein